MSRYAMDDNPRAQQESKGSSVKLDDDLDESQESVMANKGLGSKRNSEDHLP